MKKVIVGIGEVLWDVFPTGKALGGAPANFAYHAGCLGEEGWAVSAIADDDLGRELTDSLRGKLDNTLFEVVPQPTGTVQVVLDDMGKPAYNITENVAWDHIPFTPAMKALAGRADAICFGSLVQRNAESKETIISMLQAAPESCLKVFDINLRQHYYDREVLEESLKLSNVLKINDEEIDIVSELFCLGCAREDACKELIRRFNLDFVILTKGEKGSSIVTSCDVIPQPAEKVENIIDTVGAGDAFTAAFIVNYLRGESLKVSQEQASERAAYVCAHKGAMP